MIITKSLDVYREVQQQFVHKTISKSYKALLEGKVDQQEGKIILPLSVDEFNRPMQMVNYEKGKKAETLYEVLKQSEKRTLVKFTPITGRTHQLRVHAAHPEGLDAPIVGDTLYGIKDERLMLHAASITFVHPVTKEELTFETPAEFENDI
jgi:tRNA pseudouridine32 synthase/23S rRNA pseudouridine746 synthase